MWPQYLGLFYLHALPIQRFVVLFVLYAYRDLPRNLREGATRMVRQLHVSPYFLLRILSRGFLMTEDCYSSPGPRVGAIARLIGIVTILTLIPLFLLALDNRMDLQHPAMRGILDIRVGGRLLQAEDALVVFYDGRFILLGNCSGKIDGIFVKALSQGELALVMIFVIGDIIIIAVLRK